MDENKAEVIGKPQDEDKPAKAAKEESVLNALEGQLKELETQRKSLQGERDKFFQTFPGAMVMKERSKVRDTFVLVRGAV